MKTLDFIGLDPKENEKTVKELQQLLADLQVYYTNLRGLHWNIQGNAFFALHAKFEKLYDEVADRIDEVAERILILGGVPENRFSAYLKKAKVKEVGEINEAEKAILNVLADLKVVMAQERKVSDAADDADDEVTEGMMAEYLATQEKTVWMLVATLKTDKPAKAAKPTAAKSKK